MRLDLCQNTFALAIVLHSLADWLQGHNKRFIWTSACAIIVFRSELCALLGVLLLTELVSRRLNIVHFLVHSVLAAVVFLGLTVGVDSIFWRRWLWPEGEVLWYNTFLNKSSNWGTSPLLWYFYSVLPRALGCSIVLVPLGVYWDRGVRSLVTASLVFVTAYSLLPHKELRFIVYVFPVLSTAAASACNRLWQRRNISMLRRVLSLGVAAHLLINCLVTVFLLYIARLNYPGGIAIQQLHVLEANNSDVNVHIDVFTAQTGVSRFTQLHQEWKYNKTENLKPGGLDMLQFTHLLVETRTAGLDSLSYYKDTHQVEDVIHGYSSIQLSRHSIPPVTVLTEPKIYLLKRIKS